MVITVIGLGFVGLTAAVGFAARGGHKVYGVEIDKERRDLLKSGKIPFYEPGLKENFEQTLEKNLFITDSQANAINESDCVFYCVGTPVGKNGEANLGFLINAINETLEILSNDKKPVLVIKSTVPMGTMRDCVAPLVEKSHKNAELVNNPEFLREGHCWEDFTEADRIVVGAATDSGFEILKNVYEKFSAPIHRVTPTTAEFIKYLSNTLLATMISFSNEMAHAADCAGDVEIGRAFEILHEDHRWKNNNMSSYVYPGCGYGGYCLPKDTKAMLHAGGSFGADMPILKSVINTNENIFEVIVDKIVKKLNGGKCVGILGLAFKPETDDVRDTPALKIILGLRKKGIKNILVYDPMASEEFKNRYPDIDAEYIESAEKLLENCDAAVITTAWREFARYADDDKVLDFRYMKKI